MSTCYCDTTTLEHPIHLVVNYDEHRLLGTYIPTRNPNEYAWRENLNARHVSIGQLRSLNVFDMTLTRKRGSKSVSEMLSKGMRCCQCLASWAYQMGTPVCGVLQSCKNKSSEWEMCPVPLFVLSAHVGINSKQQTSHIHMSPETSRGCILWYIWIVIKYDTNEWTEDVWNKRWILRTWRH